MTQRIVPAIWTDNVEESAASYYTEAFREARILDQGPLAGLVSIHGFELLLINGGDLYTPNPSISCLLNFDPLLFGGEEAATQYLDELYAKLNHGGVLMELGEYPFAKRYAWVQDQFGFSWQLMLTNPEGQPRPFVVPSLMFGGTNHFNAEAATNHYIDLFDASARGALIHYPADAPLDEGSVMFTDFQLMDSWFAAMDSGSFHDFTFTPGVSFMVRCRDQAEIDRYWAGLSAVPEAERCGWCLDHWGVSWQVVPDNIAELMAVPETRDRILQMGKIDLDALNS